MGELPISDEAVEATAKAMWEAGREPNPLVRAWDRTENERGKDETRRIARAATLAAFEAECFEIERAVAVDLTRQRRLVGVWVSDET
jgi:hypothetical protein